MRAYPLSKTDSDLARKTIEALQNRTDCCSACLSSPFQSDWKEYVPLAQIEKGWWAFKCDKGHYWTCGME